MTRTPPVAPPARRLFGTILLPLVLCVVFGAVGLSVLDDTLYYNPDSAHYLGWAQSLAKGNGFALLSHPEPRHYVYNAPLYSVLLTPAALTFPGSIPAAKALTMIFGMLALVLLCRLIQNSAGTVVAAIGSLFLVFNPLMILYSTQILSDVPFAAGLLSWIILAGKLDGGDMRPRVFALFVATTLGCMLTRELGVVLLAGATVWLIARMEVRRALILLGVCVLVYAMWIFRNEILVGSVEHPGTRNSNLLFSHFLTPDGSGVISEFVARWKANTGFYGWLAGSLLFVTQSAGTLYDVVRTDIPFFTRIQELGAGLFIPISCLTGGLSLAGCVILWNRSRTFRVLMVIPVLYAGILLSYPVADIRFLFPLLLFEIMVSAVAVREIFRFLVNRSPGRRMIFMIAGISLAFLLAIPNLSWTANFIGTSLHYRQAGVNGTTSAPAGEDYPAEFAKPFSAAMRWIVAHTDSDAIIGSHYAEIANWAQGRHVLDVSPFQSSESFEAAIRDYEIPYLVTLSDQYGANEFALLLPAVRCFRFESVFIAGDVEILRVLPRPPDQRKGDRKAAEVVDSLGNIPTGGEQGKSIAQHLFKEGIDLLYRGRAKEAQGIFERLRNFQRVALPATYCAGLAAELAADPNEATAYFLHLRTFPQSGPFVRQAKYHLEVLENLRRAERASDPAEKVAGLSGVALAYWDLGFRSRAMEVLRKAIIADPRSFPPYAFGSIFELELGDTLAARAYSLEADRLRPDETISRSLHTIFQNIDSLRVTGSAREASDRMAAIASQYSSLGLYNMATEELRGILRFNPSDALTLKLLADLYISKECFAPAASELRKLVAANPENIRAKEDLRKLEAMWQ